jgi:hypothetical protein
MDTNFHSVTAAFGLPKDDQTFSEFSYLLLCVVLVCTAGILCSFSCVNVYYNLQIKPDK